MRSRLAWWGLVWFALKTVGMMGPACCHADVVWLNSGERYTGVIESVDASQLVLMKWTGAEPRYRRIVLSPDDVARWVRTIDPTRLEQFGPSHPGAYRDYADELASLTSDPAAIDLARRLYLLAAYWGREATRSGGLVGLWHLAPTSDEQRRIGELAIREQPHRVREWLLRQRQSTPDGDRSIGASLFRPRAAWLDAVRLTRQSRFNAALDHLQALRDTAGDWTEREAAAFEWLQAVGRSGTIDQVQLRRMVDLELALQAPVEPAGGEHDAVPHGDDTVRFRDNRLADPSASDPSVWRRVHQLPAADLRSVDFYSITPFDPLLARYRDGEWVSGEP